MSITQGEVVLLNPGEFEEAFAAAKADQLAGERAELLTQRSAEANEGSIRDAKRRSKLQLNGRKTLLWNRDSPKLALDGIIITPEEAAVFGLQSDERNLEGNMILTDPTDIAKAIGKSWESTFTAKPIDTEEVDDILAEYDKTWDWSLSSQPTDAAISGYMSDLKHCAPSLDGIINDAWRNSGPHGKEYCCALVNEAMGHASLPAKCKEGLFVWPAKPVDNATSNEGDKRLLRRPKDLRPLTLKPADNKIVAGVINFAILPTLMASASALQRGFVPGRQLAQNVVDLDFWGRLYALRFCTNHDKWRYNLSIALTAIASICDFPIIALFDYASAFPSVAHAWILAVFRVIKIPRGVLNAFNALYSGNEGFSSIGGLIVWIFSVTCGVLQGCPFSGSLFVIAIDPLLHLFEKYIHSPGLGRIYACADDIGAAVTSVRALIIVFHLFARMTKASGLTLKPSKCVLIPLAFELTAENVATLREWLRINIPAWCDIQICSKGKY